MATFIFDLGTRWKLLVSLKLRPSWLLKSVQYALDWRLVLNVNQFGFCVVFAEAQHFTMKEC